MDELQNAELDGLRVKEARLRRELDTVETAERIRDLECRIEVARKREGFTMEGLQSAELDRLQVKKARLRRELDMVETTESIRDLECRIEAARKRTPPAPGQEIDDSPTGQHQAQASVLVSSSPRLLPAEDAGNQEHQEETVRETAHQAPQSEEILPAPVHSEAGLGTSPTLVRDVPPLGLAMTGALSSPGSSSIVQPRPTALASISDNNNASFDPEVMPLQYYHELDDDGESDAELLFFDMDLEQLHGYADILGEGNPRSDAKQLEQLSRLLYFIFTKTQEVDDIQRAINKAEEVLTATTRIDDPNYTRFLKNLIVMLIKKYENTQSLEDLDQAILRAEEMATMPLDSSYSSIDLFFMKARKAMMTSTTEDRDEATSWAMRVMEQNTNQTRQFTIEKLQQTNNLNDIQTAVQGAERSVEAAPRNHLSRVIALNNSANSLSLLFERTGLLEDLERSIQTAEEALEAVPHNHPYRAKLLGNLAAALGMKCLRTGNLSDLQIAIQKTEEAVKSMPNNDPERPKLLSNLSVSLYFRFMGTGDTSDLQMSIDKSKEALEAMPLNHPDRAKLLSNLAAALGIKYRRTHDHEALRTAIQNSKEALGATAPGHPDRAKMLANLASSCRIEFEHTGNPEDLQVAIQTTEDAIIEAMRHNNPDIASMLSNQCVLFQAKYEQTLDPDDLQMSIKRAEEAEKAMAMAAPDHSDRAQILSSLALSLRVRSKLTGDQKDAKRAASLYVAAMDMPAAPPRIRIRAAFYAAEILANSQEWAEVCRITEIAINLLPTVAPRQLQQHDQQNMLGEFAGLASLAASAALEAKNDAAHAVQLLELGRSVILGLRFGTRSDLTKLKEQHREMAEKFEKLRDILDAPSSNTFATPAPVASTVDTNGRHNASFELNAIIDQIRNLSGFENFLRPPHVDELMAAASLGPVVVINISKYRCDAFLVSEDVIRSIRLTDLKQAEIEEQVKLMRSIRAGTASSAQAWDMSRMLEWLWNAAVRPILDQLRFLKPPENKWPRIWWIPTGPLSLLPLHAAGLTSPQSTESALDRVVSSYSSSIKALIYARRNPPKSLSPSESREALLVSMDVTPKYPNLVFAKEEVNNLASLFPDSVRTVTLNRPCRRDVLKSLGTCTMFHFAGHGKSDSSDPSKSSLLLKDWEEEPLTVEHLVGLNLSRKSPWLAYLSACSTGENGAENLYDEAINLVSVCQLAGFQNVVGSLWEVSDKYSMDAAEEVYKTIRDGDGDAFDSERIAMGVHRAARFLRDITNNASEAQSSNALGSGEDNGGGSGRSDRTLRPAGYKRREVDRCGPLVWAAYIHVGP
ncbi:hypothetical protein NUW58_g356 [Xylaria curta]|uniref:Uncharacterized protein n=1 Tax=Xylaria curta TaxID=42375 RepID=A0ACC1PQQ3_9PEZI|nr:hypothetical protein NUW58_g356 [Xylaria curta]